METETEDGDKEVEEHVMFGRRENDRQHKKKKERKKRKKLAVGDKKQNKTKNEKHQQKPKLSIRGKSSLTYRL